MPYTVHEAKTNLSKLIREASAGKEVIIARGKKPVAKLVGIQEKRIKRIPGEFAGQFSYTPDAFHPLSDEELKELGFG
jgi:prevent-host-death family protein